MSGPLDPERGRDLHQDLARDLEGLAQRGLLRALDDAPAGGADFVTNDVLGLARHPALIEAARAALEEHGTGAGAARLLGGGLPRTPRPSAPRRAGSARKRRCSSPRATRPTWGS